MNLNVKKVILISSVIVIIALLAEAARENILQGWIRVQKKYKKELIKVAKTPQEMKAAKDFQIRMRQVVLPELNRVDRCVTCHVAIEDQRMTHMEEPLRPHPLPYLENHDVEKFGCTICHDGQGRAITFMNALAHGKGKYWEKPVLTQPFMQANCYRCHETSRGEKTPEWNNGKELFDSKGCLGCHQIDGKGGNRGPDISNISNASFHVKTPSHENRDQLLEKFSKNVNLAFLYESVKYPHAKPAESAMIDYGLTDREAENLTVYLKSLTTEIIPMSLMPENTKERIVTAFDRGQILFGQYCSACHGPSGEGTHLKELEIIGPAISNKEFLAIADDELIEHVISFGRGGEMPGFAVTGGLNQGDIKDLRIYLKSLKQKPPTFEEVMSVDGNEHYGENIFQGKCASCHGVEGAHDKDLIGPTLNNPALLGLATKKFWYETIVKGRPGTAMPAWHFLKKEQLADLIAYLESLKPDLLDREETMALLLNASIENGEKLYRGNCSSCHGLDGEGSIAPNISNQEFHQISDQEFIFNVLTKGREGSAMPSWNHLSEEDAADIIAFVKSWQKGESVELTDDPVYGSERQGEVIFNESCTVCHGLDSGSMLAPSILSKSFLEQVNDQYIKYTIMHGRGQTQMRAALKGKGGIAELTEDEINSVVAYIRSFENNPVKTEGISLVHGEPKDGQKIFKSSCSQCHGDYGEGGVGPAIGKSGFLDTVSDGFIYAMVRMGRKGSEMKAFPPHGDGFSNIDDKDVSDLISFLRSELNVADKHNKKVRGVPERGRVLFAANCSQCHGGQGKEGIAPELINKQFLEAASDSYLQATMSLGRHGTQMRPMMVGGGGVVELNSQEVNDIINYLRSLVEQE